jgi:hypothetical protein
MCILYPYDSCVFAACILYMILWPDLRSAWRSPADASSILPRARCCSPTGKLGTIIACWIVHVTYTSHIQFSVSVLLVKMDTSNKQSVEIRATRCCKLIIYFQLVPSPVCVVAWMYCSLKRDRICQLHIVTREKMYSLGNVRLSKRRAHCCSLCDRPAHRGYVRDCWTHHMTRCFI